MKTSILIENGYTQIILKPESDFETDILEKCCEREINSSITFCADHQMYNTINHRIIIDVNEKPEPKVKRS